MTTPQDADFRPVRVLPDARRLGEGDGVRFRVVVDGVPSEAFAVRYKGGLFAYLNTCPHERLSLDFGDAHFFDDEYDALVCCHHGARFAPGSGRCVAGPALGGRLTRLVLDQRGAELWCVGRAGPD
jgi:nitrite reductase/ring-hydroxylating ferredoxin subunit